MSEISELRRFERAFPDRLLLEEKKRLGENITIRIYALYDGNKRGEECTIGYTIVIENGRPHMLDAKEIRIQKGETSCLYHETMSHAYEEYEKLQEGLIIPSDQELEEKKRRPETPEENANRESLQAKYGVALEGI